MTFTDFFNFSIYFHVSQFDDFFLFCFQDIIIAQEDIDDLQTDSDHDKDDTVDMQMKVCNDDRLYDISTEQIYM